MRQPKPTKKVVYRRHNVPAIILEGLFLNNFNWRIGDRYAVSYHYNSINIAKVTDCPIEQKQTTI